MLKKEGLYTVIIIALLMCTLYFGYEKYFGKNNSNCNSCENTSSSTTASSSDNILDKFVGKYVSSEYDEEKLDELDKYAYLEIKEDGTAEFRKVFKSGDGAYGEGKIAVSDNKIYLFNDRCNVPTVIDGECVFVNCLNVIEFDYNGNILVANNYNIELKKQ